MDRDELDRLPAAYAEAFALRRQGLADADLADRLGIELAALPAFWMLAEEKARRLGAGGADHDPFDPSASPGAPA